jgi:DNA-binding NarL/FixJ family response regulator
MEDPRSRTEDLNSMEHFASHQGLPKVVVCGVNEKLLEIHCLLNSSKQYSSQFSSNPAEAFAMCEGACVLLLGADVITPAACAEVRVRTSLNELLRVLVVSRKCGDEAAASWLRQGFSGVLQEDSSRETIVKAIECVQDGELWASRKLQSHAMRAMTSVLNGGVFTRRELEILQRIAAGQDNRSIAEELFISRETVRWHLRSAYAKLGLHDRGSVSGLLSARSSE